MSLKNLHRGITILMPHVDNLEREGFSCEHDQFYAYATATPLSNGEVEEMWSLGWFQPDAEHGCPDDEADRAYDPEEGWSMYC